jgi:hypothetical protein
MQSEHDAAAQRPFILPIQILAALVLTYLITVHTLANYLATSAPQSALRLNSSQPLALTLLAERALPAIVGPAESPDAANPENARLEGFARLPKLDLPDDGGSAASMAESADPDAGGQTGEAAAQVRDWLQRALAKHPLDAKALGFLATLSIGDKEDDKALALMTAASSRSSRVPLANYWLMKTSYEAKNYPEALRHADRLARTGPSNVTLIAPYLGRIADAATDDMAAMLLTNPPWRASFFQWLKGNIADARMPLQLLLKLKQSPVPPTQSEFGPYVALLMDNKLYDLAYAAWLQSLESEQLAHAGFIYNGGFDYSPASFPFQFDWSLKPGNGVIADLVTLEDSNRALMIRFGPGRVDFKPVSQTTMLVPGDYVLTARYRGDIKSRRGLKWTVHCAGANGTKLVESETINGSHPSWSALSLNFQVPKQDCRAQVVRLFLDARSASETLVSGSIVVDDVAIMRQGKNGVAE